MKCPKCHRPMNEGNSPNSAECHGPDDEEGLCESYSKIYELQMELNRIKDGIMRGQITMIIDGNDMIDWGWTTQAICNEKILAAKREQARFDRDLRDEIRG